MQQKALVTAVIILRAQDTRRQRGLCTENGGAILEFRMADRIQKAHFIEPMLLLRSDKLPEGPGWLHELKFNGYRALAIKSGGKLRLRSRNDKDFSARYPGIGRGIASQAARPSIERA